MASRKPNVLLIFVDNQPASMMGCYGNDEIFTPNLKEEDAWPADIRSNAYGFEKLVAEEVMTDDPQSTATARPASQAGTTTTPLATAPVQTGTAPATVLPAVSTRVLRNRRVDALRTQPTSGVAMALSPTSATTVTAGKRSRSSTSRKSTPNEGGRRSSVKQTDKDSVRQQMFQTTAKKKEQATTKSNRRSNGASAASVGNTVFTNGIHHRLKNVSEFSPPIGRSTCTECRKHATKDNSGVFKMPDGSSCPRSRMACAQCSPKYPRFCGGRCFQLYHRSLPKPRPAQKQPPWR